MTESIPEGSGWVLDEYDGPRFWGHVNFSGGRAYLADPLSELDASAGECWTWNGWNGDGYGMFRIWGKILGAHRIAFRDFNHNLPDELEIDHLCRVHACVRPNHLEPVTRSVNAKRGATPGARRRLRDAALSAL